MRLRADWPLGAAPWVRGRGDHHEPGKVAARSHLEPWGQRASLPSCLTATVGPHALGGLRLGPPRKPSRSPLQAFLTRQSWADAGGPEVLRVLRGCRVVCCVGEGRRVSAAHSSLSDQAGSGAH